MDRCAPGLSWCAISRKLGLGKGTVCRAFQAAAGAMRVSQNPKTVALSSETEETRDPELIVKLKAALYRIKRARELHEARWGRPKVY